MVLTALFGKAAFAALLAVSVVFLGCGGNSPSDPDPVDTTALKEAITAANTAKNGVTASADGTDVPATASWVTQAELTLFNAAIAAAQSIYDDVNADQATVTGAATTLEAATAAFIGQKQAGTKYTAIYTVGRGSGDVPASQIVDEGTAITLPNQGSMTAPSGETFDGWKDGVGTAYAAGTSYTVQANVTFTAQWKTSGTNGMVTYKATAADGSTYTLKITEVEGNVAKAGDTYELTITPLNGPAKTSTGTVQTAGTTLTLKPKTSDTTFEVTVSSNGITKISGPITFDDGSTQGPPSVTPGGIEGDLKLESATIVDLLFDQSGGVLTKDVITGWITTLGNKTFGGFYDFLDDSGFIQGYPFEDMFGSLYTDAAGKTKVTKTTPLTPTTKVYFPEGFGLGGTGEGDDVEPVGTLILTGLDAYNGKYVMAVSLDGKLYGIGGIKTMTIAKGAKIINGSATCPAVFDKVAVGVYTGSGTVTFTVSIFVVEELNDPLTPAQQAAKVGEGTATVTLSNGSGKGEVTGIITP
jgi:hypothetical protein